MSYVVCTVGYTQHNKSTYIEYEAGNEGKMCYELCFRRYLLYTAAHLYMWFGACCDNGL